METKNTSVIKQNKNIIFIAIVTALILMVPFLAMQFDLRVAEPGDYTSDKVNWSIMDFVLMGTLIFGTGLMLNLIIRKVKGVSYKVLLVIGVLLAFLYIW